ncbi:MAG: TetR/AcrR family transcriptional regulator [Polyangiaceae bacterium]|nr:TetR/AcrR family transcriptional regulator [Polyangiaceae bacterium]
MATVDSSAGKPHRTRAERVVHDVLEATLDELAHAGFGALSVEDVATRAGVNKTTVYRRWPTKNELVHAALLRFTEEVPTPDTGSVEEDLVAFVTSGLALVGTPRGQALVRMFHTESLTPTLLAMALGTQQAQERQYRTILRRAVSRKELPQGADLALLADAIEGALRLRWIAHQERVGTGYVRRLVTFALAGARALGASGARLSAAPRPRARIARPTRGPFPTPARPRRAR